MGLQCLCGSCYQQERVTYSGVDICEEGVGALCSNGGGEVSVLYRLLRTFFVYLHRCFSPVSLKDVWGGKNMRKERYAHQNWQQYFLGLTDSKMLHLF